VFCFNAIPNYDTLLLLLSTIILMEKHLKFSGKLKPEIFRNIPEKYEIFWESFSAQHH